jgi:hypothetical protein
LNWFQIIGRIDLSCRPNRPESTIVLQNDGHQLRRNTQTGRHIIPRLTLDQFEFILRCYLAHKDKKKGTDLFTGQINENELFIF